MNEFASGRWVVTDGKDDAFVQHWTEFLQWSRAETPGLIEAHLLRDVENPRSYISLSEWTDAASRQAWKDHPDFRAHLDAARSLCDEFSSSDFELATEVK